MKACTIGNRHKWSFVKNAIHTTYGAGTAHISKVGIYKCECGERKRGAYRMENFQ